MSTEQLGLPYMGSKNEIAAKVLSCIPSGGRFVDVFAGGCAITHAALIAGRWDAYLANDIGDAPQLFLAAIRGDYSDECRWVSRETFEREKDTDPYVRYLWSFGNNGDSYMYSREIEPWMEAFHRAVFFADTGVFREMGIVGLHPYGLTPAARFSSLRRQITRRHLDIYRRWYAETMLTSKGPELARAIERTSEEVERQAAELRTYLRDALARSGAKARDINALLGTGMAGHYFGSSQWEFPTPEAYAKMQEAYPAFDRPYGACGAYLAALHSLQRLQSLQRLESLHSLQRLQSLQRLESLHSLQRLQRLEVTNGDYRDIDIRPGDIVYCDPPYIGTAGYGVDFDHEAFYNWACSLSVPVYISEYRMPEDRFDCIAMFTRRALLSSTSRKITEEKLFIPRR